MPTSQEIFFSEILSEAVIPAGKLEYFRSRLSNKFHEFIVDEFIKLSKEKNFTKADLARRIGKSPAQITRWLGEPSNWTTDTLSDLALGMGFEPNVTRQDLVAHVEAPQIVAPTAVLDVRPDTGGRTARGSLRIIGGSAQNYAGTLSSTGPAQREQQSQKAYA